MSASLRENHWANEWNLIKDDYKDISQVVQFYSAGKELILNIKENEEIFIFINSMELGKWDYSVSQIPPDTLKLCTYVSRLEQNGQMTTQTVNTVYYDKNGYYYLTDAPGGISQVKMSDQAARYLIELAGLELSGAQKFSGHQSYDFADSDKTTMCPSTLRLLLD